MELRIGVHCGKEVDWDEIINYSFDDYIPLFKVKACMEHRERFSEAGLRAPCYACKYYNHSLNFELERMMGWRWTADKREELKAVIVAELLLSDGIKIRSMRETQHSIIGDTLKGLGCTYWGCADRNTLIRGSFLDYFFRILQIYYEDVPLFLGKPPSTPNKLEKAMLLFWEASIFYEMTGDSRTPYELNKHLIDILNAYLKVHGDVAHSVIKRKLKEIKKYIIDRAIRDLYAHYDHIHLVEIQKMKDIFEKDAFVQAALCVRKGMKGWRLDSSVKVSMAETLKSAVLKLISIDTFRHLTKTEQLEAVLRFYERGIDMHSEGKTYKEMIRTLYFLDDDLNNDTCQLAFSVERFLINSGWIQENRKKIKKQSSSIYNSDKYFRKS